MPWVATAAGHKANGQMISPRAPRLFLNMALSTVEVHFLNEMASYYGIARIEFLRRVLIDSALEYAGLGIYTFPERGKSLDKSITTRAMLKRGIGKSKRGELTPKPSEDKAKD